MIDCTFENGNKASPPLRHVVIDALVIKDDKILLVKRAPQLTAGGKWADIGGFIGHGEFLKQTVAREVLEETGYTIKDITLLTIRDNPDRNENRQNISFVYVCTPIEKTGEADKESTEVKWFAFDELPDEKEFAFDHYQIIQLYLKYKKEHLTLPIID
jgi:ADP-ribose pyrophosphatase YjhB (NUDIX family)